MPWGRGGQMKGEEGREKATPLGHRPVPMGMFASVWVCVCVERGAESMRRGGENAAQAPAGAAKERQVSTGRSRLAVDLRVGEGSFLRAPEISSLRGPELPQASDATGLTRRHPPLQHLLRADHLRGLLGGLHLQHVLYGFPLVSQHVLQFLRIHGFCWVGRAGLPAARTQRGLLPRPAPPSTLKSPSAAHPPGPRCILTQRAAAWDQSLPVSPVTASVTASPALPEARDSWTDQVEDGGSPRGHCVCQLSG